MNIEGNCTQSFQLERRMDSMSRLKFSPYLAVTDKTTVVVEAVFRTSDMRAEFLLARYC